MPPKHSTSVSNDDLMTALKSFKAEMMASSKAISDLQVTQYEDLKTGLSNLCAQMAEIKAENTMLRSEIDVLKVKVASLESSCSVGQPQSVVTQVLQETFERDRCRLNLIAYGVPESTSMAVPQKIAHDRQSLGNILTSLGDVIPLSSKLVRLGKVRGDNAARPIKIIFENTESASRVLSQFYQARQSGSSFLDGFRLVRDKTVLERKLLRNCHAELDRRTKSGENGLRVIYKNGTPIVGSALQKNGGGRRIPPAINPQPY
jgi:hypothetical protein